MTDTPQTPILPQALPHRAGWTWIVESWRVFKLSIGNWVSVAFTYMLLILLASHIREAWVLILPFGLTFLAGGLIQIASRIEDDEAADMGDLFIGFTKPYRGALFKLGALNFGGTLLTLALMLIVGWFVGIPQVGVLDALRNLNHMMMFWAPLWPLFSALLFGLFTINAITILAAGHIVHNKMSVTAAASRANLTFTLNWKPILRMLMTLVLFVCIAIFVLVLGIFVPKLLAPLIGASAAASLAMFLILLPVVITVVVVFQLLLISIYRCWRSTLNQVEN